MNIDILTLEEYERLKTEYEKKKIIYILVDENQVVIVYENEKKKTN